MNTRQRAGWATIAAGLLTTVGSLALIGGSASAGAPVYPTPDINDSQSINLRSNTAAAEDDCPDSTNQWWHFLVPPNGNPSQVYSLVSISLTVAGVNGGDPVEYTPSSADYALSSSGHLSSFFIKVPTGATVTDLVTATALVTPASPEIEYVNLSHTCVPETETTEPPTVPSTEPPVTEPPVTEPPVTEPPVTEPPVTEPPVTEPPAPSSSVEVEPPVITEPPVTTVSVESEAVLPETGSNTTSLLLVLGGLLSGLGIIVVSAGRRTAN